MEEKQIVYFPSLSAGAFASPLKKNAEIAPGISIRFWDDSVPEEWRYKYFLLTGGHHYKKMDIRNEWGLQDSLVFGDSGGYQISTGAMKWDLKLRDQIFEWLEANSDIACNLDIPPRGSYLNKFHDSLNVSFDNFKYFEGKQTGKTKFLNVIQGSNPIEYSEWYHTVKDLQFGGWCLGSVSKRLVDFMYVLALMLENKEFDKKHIDWIHLLGASKVSDFFILKKMQQLLNKLTNNRITLSTDSSSPGQYPIFGQMIWAPNFKDQVYNMLYFPKDGSKINYPDTGHVPSLINHPGVKHLTYEMVKNYTTPAVTRITYHNLYMYVYTVDQVNTLMDSCPLDVLAELLPMDLIHALKSMEEMFESSNPIQVYEKYRHHYLKFGGETLNNYSKEIQCEFFDIN